VAEGEGFEPPLPFRVKRFSRPPVSTAHTSLRVSVISSLPASNYSQTDGPVVHPQHVPSRIKNQLFTGILLEAPLAISLQPAPTYKDVLRARGSTSCSDSRLSVAAFSVGHACGLCIEFLVNNTPKKTSIPFDRSGGHVNVVSKQDEW
jgi:hypothetical protein